MNRYFKFLSNLVGSKDFDLLLRELHRIEFYSLVPNDDNRGEDGKKLREIYLDNEGSHMGSSLLPQGPCTVLEMLIGLSFRMENELEGGKDRKNAPECFWMLIENLNLAWCDDKEYFERDSLDIINDKIQIFLDRTYDRRGVGGLFPLDKTRNDQRKVEIWYQMAEYLLEKYDF